MINMYCEPFQIFRASTFLAQVQCSYVAMKKCATCVITLVGFHPTLAPVGTPDLILCLKKTKTIYKAVTLFARA